MVPLDQHLSLLPMTDQLHNKLAGVGAAEFDEYWELAAGLERALAACSERGPVAYVAAEYWGGVGTQYAQVWSGGRSTFGPLQTTEGEPDDPAVGGPISQALRLLGVDRAGHVDEFDAVELGRHRHTLDWRPSTG